MSEMYHPVHLLLFYLGMGMMFVSIFLARYWLAVFIAGVCVSAAGMLYYWFRVL